VGDQGRAFEAASARMKTQLSTATAVQHVSARLCCALVACALWLAAAPARAEQDEPLHGLATLSFGAPLRLTRNVDLDQNQVAPAFVDAMLGVTLLHGSTLQHGLGLGASLNVTGEGGYTEPVVPGQQLVLMPAYLMFLPFDPDWVALAHLGVPFSLTGVPSFGFELAIGGGYRCLAGVLAYAELGFTSFIGTTGTLHPMIGLELGFMLDYEVLP
jgi:hypothetical protein